MKGILGMVGTFVGGSIGWWLGARVGITTAVILSALGAGAGLYLVRRLAEDYLE